MHMLTKKRILWVGLGGTLLAAVLIYFYSGTSTSICPYQLTLDCISMSIAYELLIFVPILVLSLITYRMKEEIFLTWRKFTISYLSVYLFIIIISPWRHANFSPLEKGPNALFLLGLYTAISIILIASKSFSLRKKS